MAGNASAASSRTGHARRAIRLDEVMYRYSHRFGKGACLAPERGTDTTTPCPAVLAGSCSARTTIGIAIPSHLASLGLLARPGELYGGPIAIYRMLAICERFAWCRCLKLRQSAFTAQIDRHIVREERSEEHTSELQSLMRISYPVFFSKNKKQTHTHYTSLHI